MDKFKVAVVSGYRGERWSVSEEGKAVSLNAPRYETREEAQAKADELNAKCARPGPLCITVYQDGSLMTKARGESYRPFASWASFLLWETPDLSHYPAIYVQYVGQLATF